MPNMQVVDRTGQELMLAELLDAGIPTVIVFVDPKGCTHCLELFPEIAQWQAKYHGNLNLLVLSTRLSPSDWEIADKAKVDNILEQSVYEAFESFEVPKIPSATVIHPSGTIWAPIAIGPEGIYDLLELASKR